jgi:hypothetical protein
LLNLVDSGAGSPALCDSITAWVERAYAGASFEIGAEDLVAQTDSWTVVVSCDRDSVRVAVTPDLETSATLLRGLS